MRKTIILFTLAVLVCSCQDILNTSPENQISEGKMWTSQAMSRAGMDGLMYPFYRNISGLSTLMSSDGKGGINRMGMEGMGYTSLFDGTIPFLKEATKKAGGVENAAEWKNLFTAVQACNTAIARLKKEVVGEELYQQYICEARMIRAFCYSRLNMVFGEVPVYLEETTNAQCTKTQDSWDAVWTMVISECTECIENPLFQLNNFTGERLYKPSKGMAYALRGNAYMWLAANKNPEIYEGAAGISAEEIRKYYSLAAADFAEVKKCGFGLWTGAWEDMFLPANEHNREMIFPLEYTLTDGYSSSWQWVIGTRSQLNAWDRLVPSSDFVDDFEWADGSKFDWSQVFPAWNRLTEQQREVFFLRDSLNTFAAAVDAGSDNEKYITLTAQREKVISRIGEDVYNDYYLDLGNEARLRKAYDGRDPRLDKAVITPYKPYKMFNESCARPIDFVLRWPRFKRQDGESGSDLWVELSANMVYAWNKYIVADASTNDRNWDETDWPLLRFTQIQLMWAEALVGMGEVGKAVILLNEIRARAGMPDVTSSDPAEVLEEIRYESRVELCQEGKDFFNEIRWGTFQQTKFQGKKFWDPRSCWGQGGWKTGYYYTKGMWPLSAPLDEIVMNANLKRRPNWAY
ncbi:MAG: RagB/SusD family nutrient uptake outer membrane protein [Bacteroidales bacterium]|nr:RagB/SusD family nutrient uptake outer membrane protein [Bacteroidales bacterium]